MDVDLERTTSEDIIQIGCMKVPVEDDGKRPIVIDNKAKTSIQRAFAANDHEASGSSSSSKYFLQGGVPLV